MIESGRVPQAFEALPGVEETQDLGPRVGRGICDSSRLEESGRGRHVLTAVRPARQGLRPMGVNAFALDARSALVHR